MASLRALCREFLLQHVETVLASQDAAGLYWADFGFATDLPTIFHQYTHYPLAVLYGDDAPDNRYRGDARLLQSVARSLEATCQALHSDGTFALTSRGFDWGVAVDEWRVYFWLRTLETLGDRLDAGLRARCVAGITCAMQAIREGVATQAASPDFAAGGAVSNHFMWHVLTLYHAGQWLGHPAWQALAADVFDRIIRAQHPDGYWLEGGGLTTLYNHVSLMAVSLYHEYSGDPAALDAVTRALEMHKHFTYPNGAVVEVADGRVRYDCLPLPILPPSWARTAQGAAHLRHLVSQVLAAPFGEGHQGYAFFADVYCCMPDETPDEPLHLLPRYALREDMAVIRRNGPWLLGVSALTAPLTECRWFLDRQNHLVLWHAAAGHLAGGGGSKEQPDFSTFTVEGHGAVHYCAEAGEIRALAQGEELLLRFAGEVTCRVSVMLADARTVIFTASHDARNAAVTFRLPLDVHPGTVITANGDAITLDETARVFPAHGVSGPGWTLEAPAAATLRWPVLPFNSYRQDNTPTFDSAMLVLACPVGDAPVTIRLTCPA
jgi:hypothetical protein